jgi:hypothetical protein
MSAIHNEGAQSVMMLLSNDGLERSTVYVFRVSESTHVRKEIVLNYSDKVRPVTEPYARQCL